MRLMVAGSAGQLAGEIIAQAEDAGHEVVAPPEDKLDITNFKGVISAVGQAKPDIVINCAAFNDVDGAEEKLHDALRVNGTAVRNLAHAANSTGAVLVHYSTDYVFDGKSGRPYTIADTPNPISEYGRSKLLGETLAREHAERYYVIRTSWVFGGGQFSFPKKVKEWAEGKDVLRIVEDQTAGPTYTVDLAEATLRLIDTGNFGLYHITNTGHASRYEWAEFVLSMVGWKGTLERARSAEFKTPAERPVFSVLDNFPLKETIGWEMPTWQDATTRFMKRKGI